MRGILLVSALSIAFVAACSNDGTKLDEGPKPASVAQQLFAQDVEPILKGSCVDCHSNPMDAHKAPDFLDIKPGDYYASLVSRKDFVSCDVGNSLLLLEGLDPNHPGGGLTGPQHEKIEAWLRKEAIDRFNGMCAGSLQSGGAGGGGDAGAPTGPLTALDALKQFGDCMTLDDWKARGMPEVGNQTALYNKEQVTCYSCHYTGPGGNWMPDPADTLAVADAFEEMHRIYSIFNLVRLTQNDEDGSFKDIVQSNRWRDKTKDEEHPPYELAQVYQDSIDAWFNLTYEKWKNGPCTP